MLASEIGEKQQKRSHRPYGRALVLSGLLFLFSCATADAAILFVTPPTGAFEVGAVVSVDINVDTEGEAINAVSGTLLYPSSHLIPLATITRNSFVRFWIDGPRFESSQNLVVFEGLTPNPGFTGTGVVATVRFRVQEPGEIPLRFTAGSVLANDGKGTSVLSGFEDAHFSARHGQSSTASQNQPGNTTPSLTPLQNSIIRAPIVMGYSSNPRSPNDFFVQGITYPNTTISLFLQIGDKEPELITFPSDTAGNFSYQYATRGDFPAERKYASISSLGELVRGTAYRFWLSTVVDNQETPKTEVFTVRVGGFGAPELLIALAILLFVGVCLLLVFEMTLLARIRSSLHGHMRNEHVSPRNTEHAP